jgi:hypothetical protein
MKNVGSKITKQIDILYTSNQGFIDSKVNEHLLRISDVHFEEMLEQIQNKMPCIPIVRLLLRKNK